MNQQLPPIYRAFRWLIRRLLNLFFKEIRYRGADQVDTDSGGLVIAWHPNGLIDPALIFSYFPGRIVFGARHGLLEWPLLGPLFRAIGTVPIYRASDESNQSREERFNANQKSLEALATELAGGSFSALFPEGLSHDHPHLSTVKTGAARLYFQALSMRKEGAPIPVIIPVGLIYDQKNIFRSRALVLFHDPIQIPAELLAPVPDDEDKAVARQRVKALTALIKDTLAEKSRVTENWALYDLMHRTRKLIRAERSYRAGTQLGRPDIEEFEAGFSRVWRAYQIRSKDEKERTETLMNRVKAYDTLLTAAQLEDHEVSEKPRLISPLWIGLLTFQLITLYILLPPVLIAGFLINVIPYNLLKILDRYYSDQDKDRASVKLILGAVLFPLFWTLAAIAVVVTRNQVGALFPALPLSPILIFIITFLFAIVGGYLALRYTELSSELMRSIRVRMTGKRRKATIDKLQTERSDIFNELIAMSADLDLPGLVSDSGRISVPEPDPS